MIISSFVRSNSGGQMGFVGDPNRLNVAISRARCVVVLVWSCPSASTARKPASGRRAFVA